MSEISIDSELSNVADLLFTNKKHIKTADYIKIMEHLKNIYQAKQKVKVIFKKTCSNCLQSCSDSECSSDSEGEYDNL